MNFDYIVYMIVRRIPKGKVATYKQIAMLMGDPRMAVSVSRALHRNKYPFIIPCHRVIGSNGKISNHFAYGGAENQIAILKSEGVPFLNQTTVDLQKCKWEHSYYSFENRTRS